MRGARSVQNLLGHVPPELERRRYGRIVVEGVRTNLGPVIEMSVAGARIRGRSTWKPGEPRRVLIRAGGDAVMLVAECVWRHRSGFFGHVRGVRFREVTRDQATLLTRMARAGARSGWRAAAA